MADEITVTAELPIFHNEKSDYRQFVRRLAAFASDYVMDVAKPIMDMAEELYKQDAVVLLLDKWFVSNERYRSRRRSYLMQWAGRDEDGWDPIASYEWDDKDRETYRDALYALLVR